MKLTHKQEILATIRGETMEKLPMGVRIDLWYNYNATRNDLPEKYFTIKFFIIFSSYLMSSQYKIFKLERN